VVLDLVMPKMSGFEFLKRFRKTQRGRGTPVIAWSGMDLTAIERSELGADASITELSLEAQEWKKTQFLSSMIIRGTSK
jgi:CheY-like chemotaxis protein